MTVVERHGADRASVRAACDILGVLIHGDDGRGGARDAVEGERAVERTAAEVFADELYAKSDADVFEAMCANGGTIFSDGGDAEVRGLAAVMTSLAGEDAGKMKRVMECVTSSVSERVMLRVRCAMAVYTDASERGDVGTRLELFERVVGYCVESKQRAVLPILISHASDAKVWGNDPKVQRRVLRLSVNLLRELQASEEEVFACMLKYLVTFENDAGAVAEAADIAKETLRAFISSSTMFTGDFASLKGMQHLQTSDADALKLLSVLLTGTLSDYNALVKSNGSLISGLGLDADECMAKMRVMALSTLGMKGEVTYAEIKETLQCGDDEVEEWVVRAVGAGVVDAKMDQNMQRVVFTRCTDRVFSNAEWKRLSEQISQWRGSIDVVQKTLSAN